MSAHRSDKWDYIDWSLTTAEIMEITGVSRQRVAQKRPKGKRSIALQKKTNNFILSANYKDWLGCKTVKEISELCGVSVFNIYRYVPNELKKWRASTGFNALHINWDLPSKDIEQIWGLPLHKASYSRPQGQTPKWRMNSRDPNYKIAKELETEKAKEHYYESDE